ncbi:hypothetical protein LCGC14_1887780 [marine sediment metagenome]|uniref:Uncharacterized protein n=1 Tax=marine sediment metagenome TaxID=412755 RepID=A0A0F9IE87_9ZZZZ
MGDGVVAHTPSSFTDGTPQLYRLSRRGEIVIPDYLWQLAAEGRLYIAGLGAEETAVDSAAALDDQTPTFELAAPASGTIVVPLYMAFHMKTDGGALTQADITYSLSGTGVAGTALDPKGLLSTEPRAAVATVQHTMSAGTAQSDTNNTVIKHYEIMDAVLTTGAPMANGETSIKWTPEYPIFLYQGGALLVYLYTTTSDSTWVPTIVWAELDSSKFLE